MAFNESILGILIIPGFVRSNSPSRSKFSVTRIDISEKETEDKFVRLIKARLQQIKIELPIVIYNSGIRPEMVNSYDNQQYVFPDRLVA